MIKEMSGRTMFEKTFSSREVIKGLLKGSGQWHDGRSYNVTWRIAPDADDNTITIRETPELLLDQEKAPVSEKPKKELNFIQALTLFLFVLSIGLFIIDIVVTIDNTRTEKLATCELRGDCAEVIKSINR